MLAPDLVLFLLLLITMIQWYTFLNTRVGWLPVGERKEPWSLLLEISHIGILRDHADRRPMSKFFIRLMIFQLRCSKMTKKNLKALFHLPRRDLNHGPTRPIADPQTTALCRLPWKLAFMLKAAS
jgi:hypothetical protein